METSIHEETLTDGSIVYAVAFVDGSATAYIDCYDQKAAVALSLAMADHACDANIRCGGAQ